MNEQEILIDCPRCGERCAVVYGCGFDYDFVFCDCGFETTLETSTEVDYSE